MSAEPLRVLMVSARYLPDMGGIETHVHEVSRRLAKTGDFEITVLATDRTRSRPRRRGHRRASPCCAFQPGRATEITTSRRASPAWSDSAAGGTSSTAREFTPRCPCWPC